MLHETERTRAGETAAAMRHAGFTMCDKCLGFLKAGRMAPWAVANGHNLGWCVLEEVAEQRKLAHLCTPPEELLPTPSTVETLLLRACRAKGGMVMETQPAYTKGGALQGFPRYKVLKGSVNVFDAPDMFGEKTFKLFFIDLYIL